MFVILVKYTAPLSKVDEYLVSHRDFLEEGYQRGYFLASGPRIPRTGGVIVSQLSDRAQLEEIIKHDPYMIHDIGEYEIIEFTPVKYNVVLKDLL